MHTATRLALLAATLASGAAPLAAQSITVQAGTLVRTTLTTGSGNALVGTLLTRTPDSLTIMTRGSDAVVRIPSSAVRSIEVLNGKHRIAPAAKWAAIGAGVWGIVATAIPFDKCSERPTEYCADSRGAFVATQAAGMAIVAGAYGAYRGEEHWVNIEGGAPTAFLTPSSRGASAGLRFSF